MDKFFSFINAEDSAQNDIQSDRLHLRLKRKRAAHRPTHNGTIRDLAHHLSIRLHALTVKRRHHELSLVHMPCAVQQKHRVLPNERFQNRTRFAGRKFFWVAGKDLFHRLRMTKKHERWISWETDGKAVAIPARAFLHEWNWSVDPGEELQNRGQLWARWYGTHNSKVISNRL